MVVGYNSMQEVSRYIFGFAGGSYKVLRKLEGQLYTLFLARLLLVENASLCRASQAMSEM